MRALRILALLFLTFWQAVPAASEEGGAGSWAYLHVTPTSGGRDLDLSRGLRVALYLDAPEHLAAVLRPAAVERVAEDHLILDVARYPGRRDADPDAHRAASFVIDFDSPEILALVAQIEEQHGPTPDRTALVEAVRTVIEPGGGRGFDFASTIARERRGDCTEHAVLFAALARHFGHPTRVVLGGVLAQVEGSVQAYGHAWNEIHGAGGWEVIDATPLGGARPLAYVPYGYLVNEGPGYALDVLPQMTRAPARVEVLGNVE